MDADTGDYVDVVQIYNKILFCNNFRHKVIKIGPRMSGWDAGFHAIAGYNS